MYVYVHNLQLFSNTYGFNEQVFLQTLILNLPFSFYSTDFRGLFQYVL